MSDFAPAIAVVLQHEGGWVSNPADPGGETNFGISSLIIAREKLTAADIGVAPDTFMHAGYLKAMTVETAREIYRRLFWERYGYGGIVDQVAATKVFDCSVNCGPGRAHVFAQYSANKLGHHASCDGVMGPETLAAINACEPRAFVAAYAGEMRAYYESLVSGRPSLSVFESNWLKRARWGVQSESPVTVVTR